MQAGELTIRALGLTLRPRHDELFRQPWASHICIQRAKTSRLPRPRTNSGTLSTLHSQRRHAVGRSSPRTPTHAGPNLERPLRAGAGDCERLSGGWSPAGQGHGVIWLIRRRKSWLSAAKLAKDRPWRLRMVCEIKSQSGVRYNMPPLSSRGCCAAWRLRSRFTNAKANVSSRCM